MRKSNLTIGILMAVAGSLTAQTLQRKATFVNGGNSNGGKCTVEVVVDGSAEVQIRGNTATLRNTGGQSPQWRRFECTGAMPANPPDFRFAGVDGRGRQTLARDPRNGNGTAVVEIQDSEGGAQGYTFDLFWGNGGGPVTQDRNQQDRNQQDRNQQDRNQRDRNQQNRPLEGSDQRGFDRGDFRGGQTFTANQAVDVCQNSIKGQAVSRFRTPNIDIRAIAIDNNPGRQDWVTGELAVRKRFGRQNVYRFSCSVDFRTGQVRTAQIDQFEENSYPRRR